MSKRHDTIYYVKVEPENECIECEYINDYCRLSYAEIL